MMWGLLFYLLLGQNLSFGVEFPPLNVSSVNYGQLTLPPQDGISILYLFNIESSNHLRILADLNILRLNFPDIKSYLLAISSGSQKLFDRAKIPTNIILVNDRKRYVFKKLDFTCGQCIKIIIIDQHGIVRYVTNTIDRYFVSEILKRYSQGDD